MPNPRYILDVGDLELLENVIASADYLIRRIRRGILASPVSVQLLSEDIDRLAALVEHLDGQTDETHGL